FALAGFLGVVAVLIASATVSASTLPGFISPSGNIKCLLQTDKPQFVICEIKQAAYSATLTKHCASAPYFVDWIGFSIGVKGKGVVACAGGPPYDPDKQHPKYVTLGYGKKWQQGVFSCDSETAGVTCTNTATGHAIFVSKQTYRVS